jgi:hypothetical protein
LSYLKYNEKLWDERCGDLSYSMTTAPSITPRRALPEMEFV